MQRRARASTKNRRQAVRVPRGFQFNTDEVFVGEEEDVISSPRRQDWGPYLDDGPVASDAFMENVEDLPAQARESAEADRRMDSKLAGEGVRPKAAREEVRPFTAKQGQYLAFIYARLRRSATRKGAHARTSTDAGAVTRPGIASVPSWLTRTNIGRRTTPAPTMTRSAEP